MNTLFVPSIGLDVSLIERLAASIDFHIPRKFVMNNGPEDALEKFGDANPDWTVVEPNCGNLGVAGSWNWIANCFPKESILILNEDAHFLPGYLEKIFQCADDNPDAPAIFCNDSNAYYAFVSTAAGRKEFGSFDENLWPGYGEDFDMRLRHRLKGITTYPYALQGLPPLPHGKPRTGGINYTAMLQGCGLLNRAYFLKKWGSLDFEKATYQTPYNDHRLGVSEWVWDPKHRSELWPLWRTFLEMNPSIYD